MKKLPTIFLLLSTTSAQAHDMYEGLMSNTGISCCHDRDCAPAVPCKAEGNVEGLMPTSGKWQGKCVSINYDAVIPQSLADGGSHICLSDTGFTYCIVFGAGT